MNYGVLFFDESGGVVLYFCNIYARDPTINRDCTVVSYTAVNKHTDRVVNFDFVCSRYMNAVGCQGGVYNRFIFFNRIDRRATVVIGLD